MSARSGCAKLVLKELRQICFSKFSRKSICTTSVGYMWKSNYGTDTIYAVSSGQGKCGVAVIRVSGPMSKHVMQKMARFSGSHPKPREAILRTIVSPSSKMPLDRGLLLWFPGPDSFTGEDSCEFHVHGGIAVVSSMLSGLNEFDNTRHAEPGEFTKRAFMNGKLDLTEVEGLADIIHAETELQRQQAYKQMLGSIGELYTTWRKQIIQCTASVEAFIDFSEEENIEEDILDQVMENLTKLCDTLRDHLSDGRKGERLRNGVHVAILGEPNVGKSSLMNYLSCRQAAIVSPYAGTTRDILETHLNLRGYPIVLCDTAGLRDTDNPIESEGVKRAVGRAQIADLLVFMLDAQTFVNSTKVSQNLVDFIAKSFSHTVSEQLKLNVDEIEVPVILVINKIDKFSNSMPLLNEINIQGRNIPCVIVSVTEEINLQEFINVLVEEVKHLCSNPASENPSYTQARHRNHISNCLEHLHQVNFVLKTDTVIAAEYLRQACSEMGKLNGHISSDEVLDVVFKDFCIGK